MILEAHKCLFKIAVFLLVVIAPMMANSVHAAVWGYVDDKGQVHLANERIDDRYELFFKPGVQAADDKLELQRDVAVPRGRQRLFTYFEMSADFKAIKPLMREAAEKHKIELELLQAVIAVESGYNSRAVSPKGALGLMQIMPGTAARYGVVADKKKTVEAKLFDVRTNLHTGARYLVDLKRLFPNRLDLILASYNAGEGAVQRYKNTIPPYKETQAYVQTVTELYNALRPYKTAAYIPSNVRLQLPLMNARRNMPAGLAASPAAGATPRVKGTITTVPSGSAQNDSAKSLPAITSADITDTKSAAN
jgi:Transglycosylase SLT domain